VQFPVPSLDSSAQDNHKTRTQKTLPWVLGLNPKPLTLATGISIPQWLFEEKQSKACGNSKHMADALISY
jgi:hypothetical protein